MLTADTPIDGLDGLTVGDFWSWAYSDLLSNANRGVLSEFIVAVALGVHDQPRQEWDACDVTYRDQGIEVKSSAYLQTWQQEKPSLIIFDIAKRDEVWDARTNTWIKTSGRTAAVYVFCVFAERDPEKANVPDLSQWEFYVLSTPTIDRELGNQKTVSLNPLRKLVHPIPFGGIRGAVDAALLH